MYLLYFAIADQEIQHKLIPIFRTLVIVFSIIIIIINILTFFSTYEKIKITRASTIKVARPLKSFKKL